MASALDNLVALLDLEQIEIDIFRGLSPDVTHQRVFGGQVAGQALVAATRTVDPWTAGGLQRFVHSLHAYFLRPGDPNLPIVYTVDRIRDGRSFTTRRVVAIQHGKAIFNLQASFHVVEPGLDYQTEMPENIPAPESLPTYRERMAPYRDQLGADYDRERPIDIRYVDGVPFEPPEHSSARRQVWMRADGTLQDDPTLHACIVTWASDDTLLDTAILPHRKEWTGFNFQMASLDHAMWFHRPFRADEWLLYDQSTPSTSGARGLAFGSIYTRDGKLAVSVVQEGVIRLLR
ncbi:MAG: acyl-CoA thioesterase [Acidimicrobiia bacterium]